MLTFIIGSARSGKSALAQQLANMRGGEGVLFVATLRETIETLADAESVARIARHRADRPATWRTLVVGDHPSKEIEKMLEIHPARAVLLDCLSLLISGALFMGESVPADAESQAERVAHELLSVYRAGSAVCDWIVVSNEVGMSVVPDSAIARAYRDALGRANQTIARAADEAWLTVAGLSTRMK